MKFNYELKIGDKTFFLEDEAATMADFVKQVAPWQALEIEAAGFSGVYFSHRTTRGNDEYYALIRPAEGLELHLGIKKDQSGILFPGKYDKSKQATIKEWRKMLHCVGDWDGDEGEAGNNQFTQSASASSKPANEPPTTRQPKSEQEEKLTVQLRELLDAAGLTAVGQIKQKTISALKLKVGLTLEQLTLDQKFALYDILYNEAEQRSAKST